MNKKEKLISLLLGLGLIWCFISAPRQAEELAAGEETPAETTEASATAATNVVMQAAEPSVVTNAVVTAEPPPAALPPVEIPPPVILENDELQVAISPLGAVVTSAKLKAYADHVGPLDETENPPVVLAYARPLGRLGGVPGIGETTVFTVEDKSETAVTLVAGGVRRTYALGADYRLTLDETFAEGSRPAGANTLSLGTMKRQPGNDTVSVDSRQGGAVVHHDDDDSVLKPLLTGATGGGCGCGAAKVTADVPEFATAELKSAQDWVALKSRFFVTALVSSSQTNAGLTAEVGRDLEANVYVADNVSATLTFADGVERRTTEFFIGPKKQALLWAADMKDVMEFGWWRWLCYPVVKLLNLSYAVIPNYGVAIILLTILVRLVFWPLTRKSTEGMKKMQEIQPLLKELQAKYKDNPQRLQQETFMLYREKKVNPLSSCLPMLIQIPVFFALYKVLGASVELRHAGFLWIADLSEPERLFASWFPFGGLNILPILMAATMYFQSKLTPSAGDPSQQRLMSIFMPLMMLWMFYGFASALSLYWTLSQAMSILQMWMIRRAGERQKKVFEPEIIEPPTPTRQQRRHS